MFLKKKEDRFLNSPPDAIMEFSGGVLTVFGPNETASIFATYPTDVVSLQTSFLDQVSKRPWQIRQELCSSCKHSRITTDILKLCNLIALKQYNIIQH